MRARNGAVILKVSSKLMTSIKTTVAMTSAISLLMLNSVFAASPNPATNSSNVPLFDVEPPLIEHSPFSALQNSNSPLIVKATITDNQGIQSVWLNYRVKGMENYRVLMMKLSSTTPSMFVGVVPAAEVGTETIEYYIQATDTGGNTVLRGGMLFPLSIAFKQFPKLTPNNAFVSNTTRLETDGLFNLPRNSKTAWAWIAGGVIVGALIAKSGDSGGNTGNNPDNGGGVISVTAGGNKL